MKKLLLFYFTVTFLILGVGQAEAELISQTSTFSNTFKGTNLTATTNDSIGISPFDSALGTLDKVIISINGKTDINFTAKAYFPSSIAPASYPFGISVKQSFFGLGNKYFTFNNPAIFSWNGSGANTGGPAVWNFNNQFSYNFIFNNQTDKVGYTIPTTTNTTSQSSNSQPSSVKGLLVDFLGGNQTHSEEFMQAFTVTSPVRENPITLLTTGTITIKYYYTPINQHPKLIPNQRPILPPLKLKKI